jgi:hypothetical protein
MLALQNVEMCIFGSLFMLWCSDHDIGSRSLCNCRTCIAPTSSYVVATIDHDYLYTRKFQHRWTEQLDNFMIISEKSNRKEIRDQQAQTCILKQMLVHEVVRFQSNVSRNSRMALTND